VELELSGHLFFEVQALTMDYHPLITIDPERRSGKPCVRDTRMTVGGALGHLASGMPHQDIVAEFPNIMEEDVALACPSLLIGSAGSWWQPRPHDPGSSPGLIDQNPPPRLRTVLEGRFPGTRHVVHSRLDRKRDHVLWRYGMADNCAVECP